MMKLLSIVLCLALLFVVARASPYNKYGRTCKDILCIAGQEECVMENDACTYSSQACGSYPTCKRKAGTAKKGCASIKCNSGEFCSIRQENCSRPPCEIKPVCIAFRTSSASSTSTLNRSNPSPSNYGGVFNSNRRTYDSSSSRFGGSGQYGNTNYGSNQNGRSSWSWSSGR